jgi:hypothetical protein
MPGLCYKGIIMGRHKRGSLKFKREEKRKKRRQKLAKAGKKPEEFFYDGVYVGGKLR